MLIMVWSMARTRREFVQGPGLTRVQHEMRSETWRYLPEVDLEFGPKTSAKSVTMATPILRTQTNHFPGSLISPDMAG